MPLVAHHEGQRGFRGPMLVVIELLLQVLSGHLGASGWGTKISGFLAACCGIWIFYFYTYWGQWGFILGQPAFRIFGWDKHSL